MENIELFSRGSLGKRRRSDATSSFHDVASFVEPANPLKYCACQQKRRCGPVRSRSNCPRDGTSKNHEKRCKSRPRSTQNCGKSPVGLARAALSIDFGPSRDSGKRSEAAKLALSGQIEPATAARLAQHSTRVLGPQASLSNFVIDIHIYIYICIYIKIDR